jgi:hypothetical protein
LTLSGANAALVGTEAEVKKTILDAGWYLADSLTLKSCLEMVEAAVLKRQYDDAPVSNLFLFRPVQNKNTVRANPPGWAAPRSSSGTG